MFDVLSSGVSEFLHAWCREIDSHIVNAALKSVDFIVLIRLVEEFKVIGGGLLAGDVQFITEEAEVS